MSIKIRLVKDTESSILEAIKTRDVVEKSAFNEFVKNYQGLINFTHKMLYDSRGKTNELRQSLLTSFGSSTDTDLRSSEKMQRLNEELRDAYKKLSASNEVVVELKEKLKEENSRLQIEKEQMTLVLSDMKESLEIKTKQNNGLISENDLLKGKIKELSEDNALYFKKIMSLQEQMVQKMNDANQLYEEAKVIKQQSILKKNDEDGLSDIPKSYGIECLINDNYFNVPSKTRHKLFAHSREATCVAYTSQGTNLATGGGDGLVKLWDVDQGKELG